MAGSLSSCGNEIEASGTSTTSEQKAATSTTSEQTTTSDPGGLSGTNVGLGSKLGEGAGSLPGLDSGSADNPFAPDVVSCLDEEAAGLSTTDADAIDNDEDFSALSPEGTRIVTAALDTCVPPDVVAELFSDEFFDSFGSQPDPAFEKCLSSELDGQVGEILVESAKAADAGSEDIPQPVIDLLDACGDTVIGDLFLDEFESTGIPEDVAKCMADGLSGQLTMGDLIELGQGGELPPSLEAEIEALAESCSAGG